MASAEIIAEADRLQSSNKWRDAYEYLKPYSDTTEDPELLWRLLRSYYRIGKHLARDHQERDAVAEKGLEILKRALDKDSNHFNIQKVNLACSGDYKPVCGTVGRSLPELG